MAPTVHVKYFGCFQSISLRVSEGAAALLTVDTAHLPRLLTSPRHWHHQGHSPFAKQEHHGQASVRRLRIRLNAQVSV